LMCRMEEVGYRARPSTRKGGDWVRLAVLSVSVSATRRRMYWYLILRRRPSLSIR